MKKLIQNQRGAIALITMLILMAVGILGIGMVVNSQMSATSSKNYRNKIQTFSASDGLVTLLAQEMLDFKESNYLQKRPHMDIGAPTPGGTCGVFYDSVNASNTFDTIRGGGPFVLGTSDNFTYSYCKMNGTLELITRQTQWKPGSDNNKGDKAGIMIRQDLTAGSKYVVTTFVDLGPAPQTDSIRIESRRSTGSSSASRASVSPGGLKWLKLNKTNNIFQSYFSSDGNTWIYIGADTVSMEDPVYIGLFVGAVGSIPDTVAFTNTQGIPSNLRIDSTYVGSVPVKYGIYQMQHDGFFITTESYLQTGTAATHNYVTKLSQNLSREKNGTWHLTAVDSAYMPVIIYDVRANKTNPEFQFGSGAGAGRSTGMVQDMLDQDRKPVFKANKFHNDSLKKWFRPSGGGIDAQFDPQALQWTGLKGRPKAGGAASDTIANEWVGKYYDSTNQYANIVIYDSLKFLENKSDTTFYFGDTILPRWSIAMSTVKWPLWSYFDYVRPTQVTSIFSPLRNWNYATNSPVARSSVFPAKPTEYARGFGFDLIDTSYIGSANNHQDSLNWWSQNYGFSMEIHRQFTYKPGQRFIFMGNDDVWVFINNHLEMDIGGVHGHIKDTINLDDCGLTSGNQYWFDFFYSERNGLGSEIYITTNMLLFIPPQPLKRSWKRDYGNVD